MNKFRSFIEDEHVPVGSATPNLGEDMSSKEKIDIEMGPRLPEDSGFPIPDILCNLDYDELEGSFKNSDVERRPAFDSFFPVELKEKESIQSSTHGEGCIEPEESLTMGNEDRENLQSSPPRDTLIVSVENTRPLDETTKGVAEGNSSHKTTTVTQT